MVVMVPRWSPPTNEERSINTDKPTWLLMAGLPGVGKTKLAKALEKVLGSRWKVIDKDQHIIDLIKNGVDEAQAPGKAYEQSFQEGHSQLVEYHSSVIFDSAALHQFILHRAEEIVKKVPDAQIKVILCVADRDLREERLHTRSGLHPKPYIDLNIDRDQTKIFEHLPLEPKRLTLDMSKPFEETLIKAQKFAQKEFALSRVP